MPHCPYTPESTLRPHGRDVTGRVACTAPGEDSSGAYLTMQDTRILDATTGGKHMWHSDAKQHDRTVFADRRQVETLEHQAGWSCDPSVLCDTRDLPFKPASFDLIAYDPPHRITDDGMTQLSGVIEQKYGALRAERWQADLRQSFDELWRVLKPGGTLTFKWADIHKSHDDVLDELEQTPLYGVTTEKDRAVTKWWVFNKP